MDEIKQLNNNLNKQFKEILSKNSIENILKNLEIENVLEMSIKNDLNNENSEMPKLEKENIIINKTPRINNDININENETINLNISNGEVEPDSKKSNPLSIFKLSKVSEIKVNKMDNQDSGEKEIKNGLDILNGRTNNNLNKNEVNPFNENEDE